MRAKTESLGERRNKQGVLPVKKAVSDFREMLKTVPAAATAPRMQKACGEKGIVNFTDEKSEEAKRFLRFVVSGMFIPGTSLPRSKNARRRSTRGSGPCAPP